LDFDIKNPTGLMYCIIRFLEICILITYTEDFKFTFYVNKSASFVIGIVPGLGYTNAYNAHWPLMNLIYINTLDDIYKIMADCVKNLLKHSESNKHMELQCYNRKLDDILAICNKSLVHINKHIDECGIKLSGDLLQSTIFTDAELNEINRQRIDTIEFINNNSSKRAAELVIYNERHNHTIEYLVNWK
jgi:hypothetical protein